METSAFLVTIFGSVLSLDRSRCSEGLHQPRRFRSQLKAIKRITPA